MLRNKANIEYKALKLIDNYSVEKGMPIKPPIPVFEIVEFLGYDVDFRKDGLYSDHNYLGGLLINEKIVEINENLNHQEGRMHFTVAHEIGHIILHSKNRLIKDGSHSSMLRTNDETGDNELDKIEREADVFASYLLMPNKEVLKGFYNFRKKPFHFSKILDALQIRSYLSKRRKALNLANKIKTEGRFDNVSKLAFLNRLIEMNLIKGISFQKNFNN